MWTGAESIRPHIFDVMGERRAVGFPHCGMDNAAMRRGWVQAPLYLHRWRNLNLVIARNDARTAGRCERARSAWFRRLGEATDVCHFVVTCWMPSQYAALRCTVLR